MIKWPFNIFKKDQTEELSVTKPKYVDRSDLDREHLLRIDEQKIDEALQEDNA